MSSINVCVFGSSSTKTNSIYIEQSRRLGQLLAEKKFVCVNGAGKYGCMGALNDGCHEKGGKVIGVIHSMFCVDSEEDNRIKDLVVVDGFDLTERKQKLFEYSDIILALPGGVGTFDELFDGICARSLGMKGLTHTPFCLVNINGFYNGIIQQMQKAKEDGILYHEISSYFYVANSVEDAISWCERITPNIIDSRKKNNKSTSSKKKRSLIHVNYSNDHVLSLSLVSTILLVSVSLFGGYVISRSR